MAIKKVGVIGAGLMGAGIAQVSAAGGYKTVTREISQELLDKAFAKIDKFLTKSIEKEKITEEQKQQLRKETEKFPDAVAKVKELRDAVERETKDGIPENPFEAHQALDKAEIVVQLLPEIASKSGVAKEHWEAVNMAAGELRELFDTVHQNIDNKVDPDFASVEPQMDAKIAELEAIAP